MHISRELVEGTCKNTIETILLCLQHAVKGTIYTIGTVPDLRAVRITSGIRCSRDGLISWGLPQTSDYNPPGKTWLQYRDNPGTPLEAMGWCVERQKSWTADDPYENIRSVRKQLQGEIEDTHHMEPVLVNKRDFYGEALDRLDSPLDWQGNPIWQDTDHVVVAVIKIHFIPQSIRQGDNSTKIIKKLSATLGTELLSLHLRESFLMAQARLSHQRLQSANVLAHELRNSTMKLAFVFSAINGIMGLLREEWEIALQQKLPHLEFKSQVIASLSKALALYRKKTSAPPHILEELEQAQEDLANLSLLPEQAQKLVKERIEPRWMLILNAQNISNPLKNEIFLLLQRLVGSIWMVVDEGIIEKMDHLPTQIRHHWPRLAYSHLTMTDFHLLKEILSLLDSPEFEINRKFQLKKILTSLKIIVEVISRVEEQANRIISFVKTGDEL